MSGNKVRVMPQGITLNAEKGETLLSVLQRAQLAPDAFCGGNGKCGKCSVLLDGKSVLSCKTAVDRDMTVTLQGSHGLNILTEGAQSAVSASSGSASLAFDIGTTSVVCCLSGADGTLRAVRGCLNPQCSYGADVVSRIRSAASGTLSEQTELIRACMTELILSVCEDASIPPAEIKTVCVVGNPAMQQIFIGLGLDNLIKIPFEAKIRRAKAEPAGAYLPVLENAELLTVPDISAYVGADTVACILAECLHKSDALTLLVDIGTNGEIVLGNSERMLCCSTAAGPALEGADISCGMRGEDGAIDRVEIIGGKISCRVIGGGKARGICGSGIIDAVAKLLELGQIDRRGRIISGEDRIILCENVYLTQEDIRAVQLAKGAIAAGVSLLAREYGVSLSDIDRVLLAGAFGSAVNPASACRIGLLPPELAGKITAVGNAAGLGARLIASSYDKLSEAQYISEKAMTVELAKLPDFSREFSRQMYFSEVDYGTEKQL